ncbi:B30.2/SPRY domain-containing protein [Entamoeba marina]
MKVSLHLQTFNDIINFMLVCKKAEVAVISLKVNPFLRNSTNHKKFLSHFKVDTIKCNEINWFDPVFYEKVKYIRSPLWDDLKNEDMVIAKKLLPKITVLNLYHSIIRSTDRNKVNNFFIKEATQFTNLEKIEGELDLLINFFKEYTQDGKIKYIKFPKQITIALIKNGLIFVNETFVNQMKQLLTYILNNGITEIDVIVYSHPSEENKYLLKELLKTQRVNYHYVVISPNQTTFCEDCLCCVNGYVFVDGCVTGNKLNYLFEKSYPTTCVIKNITYDSVLPTWDIPKCISKLEINGLKPFVKNLTNSYKIFNANISFIQELSLKELRYVNFPIEMVNLVKIKVEKSNNCRVILNSTKLEYISLREVENCSFINSIDSLKEMCINNVNNCVLPFVSFEKCLIRIEDSNDLYFGQKKINGFDDNNEEKTKIELIENVRSPMEFMGIGLTDFNKLITDCLIYPSKDYLNKLTKSLKFTMRTFQPQTRRVKVDGNEIQRISYQGENGVDLVISSKFYEENDDLEFTKTNKSESPFHSIIRYFEVEINIYSFISIGVVDSTEYEYGEDRHVGWDMYSIGYHSYDGALYIENSTHPIIKERKEKGKRKM